MSDKITGFLEVGLNGDGEIVVNHPDLKPDENGVGHIVFSPNQARNLAQLLNKHANQVDPYVTDDNARSSIRANRTLARILREIRRKANYEKAGFSSFKIPGKVEMEFPFNMPFTTDELTDAIRETTRLYRDSWINPLIDGLLAWAEGKADIQQIEKHLL